jgi:hypothetical protein
MALFLDQPKKSWAPRLNLGTLKWRIFTACAWDTAEKQSGKGRMRIRLIRCDIEGREDIRYLRERRSSVANLQCPVPKIPRS